MKVHSSCIRKRCILFKSFYDVSWKGLGARPGQPGAIPFNPFKWRLLRLTDMMRSSFVLLGVLIMLSSGTAYSKDAPLIKAHLEVALIRSAFLGSNEGDAAVAFKTLAKIIGKQKGYDIEITTIVFDHADEVAALPEEKRPHIIILASWPFLQLEKHGWITPVAATSVGSKGARDTFKIVVSGSSKVKTIEDLRGKNINILMMPQTQIGHTWLRSLLVERRLGTMDTFFKNIKIEGSPIDTILPVFFEQRDAALIASEKLKLMAELNPQLNTMKTIAVSEPLLCGLTCVNNIEWNSESKIKRDFIDAMLNLHLSPAGQQILNLFKADRNVPYRPDDSEPLKKIDKILSDDASIPNRNTQETIIKRKP